jgi:predicted DNA-binding protein (MmcQ/YjbR family)
VVVKMSEICLALPDTKLTMTWGKPHYRVADKIFAGCGEEDGWYGLGFKLEMPHAKRLVASDARFRPAKYVGHKGWVTMNADGVEDWDEVRDLVHESYRLIAPKTSLAKLGAPAPAKPPAPTRQVTKRAAPKRTAARASGRKAASSNAVASRRRAR